MNELVSIIMPSFNSENTIVSAIESVKRQTYMNWELLITDDCSSDDTLNIIRKISEGEPRIKSFSLLTNSGPGAARNKSIKESSGRYIAFLDADDQWLSNKLDVQIRFMKENDVLLCYSAYQKVRRGEVVGVVYPPAKITYKKLIYSNVIGCLTAIYDSKILGKRYMPLIRKRQDMGLWLNILKDIPTAMASPGVLALYSCDTGMTKNKLTVLGYQWRFYRDVVKLGFLRSIFVFIVYAYKGVRKSAI